MSAAALRDRVALEVQKRPMTTLEIAETLGVPFESVQPRTSELRKAGRIIDTGVRSIASRSRKPSIVWGASKC